MPEALSLAREAELDLVEIAPQANPPVCKILDYGKYRYELAQREKESRKKSTNVVIKEMKYRPKIGGGDFDTKTRKVGEFLADGHKVKVTIMFRGREVAHPELGMKILERIAETCGPSAKVEATPKLDGRNMVMVLAPDKKLVPIKAARHDPSPDDPAVHPPSSADSTPAPQAPAPLPAPPAAAPQPSLPTPAAAVATVTEGALAPPAQAS